MYEIKVLNDKEFFDVAKSDKRYSYVDETNMGFADPVTGKAYVRHVAHPELQKYLINHELEELTTDEHHHEDANGIRHKKFWNIIKSIFNPINLPIPGLSRTNDEGGSGLSVPFGSPSGVGEEQQMANMFGSYSPQGSSGVSGSQNSPLNLFTSGSYSPGSVPDAASGSYTPGLLGEGKEDIPEWQRQQLSGSEDGRIVF